jgi:hypothetical protein
MFLLSHSEVLMTSTVLEETSHYLSVLLIVIDIVIRGEMEHILHTSYSMITSMKRKGRERSLKLMIERRRKTLIIQMSTTFRILMTTEHVIYDLILDLDYINLISMLIRHYTSLVIRQKSQILWPVTHS